MEWWIAVAVLLLNICENSMSAVYTERVIQRNRFLAALLGSHIDLIGTFSVIAYTENIIYLLPLFLGSFTGTYLGTYLNPHISQWLLNRERRKNLEKANLAKKMKQGTPAV